MSDSHASTNPSLQAARFPAWLRALAVSGLVLATLSWLQALVIWLPLYSGMFGFIVAGLIAGGLTFRLARRLRPVPGRHVFAAAVFLALLNSSSTLYWEFRHVADRVGKQPGFDRLRSSAARDGKPKSEIPEKATAAYLSNLADNYPPGGVVGYARWCADSGEMNIDVDGVTDLVTVSHKGWAWLLRTIGGVILTALGVWFTADALRSPTPISNTLRPGEEYEEIE